MNLKQLMGLGVIFRSVEMIDVDGESAQQWTQDKSEKEVDEAMIHLSDQEKKNKEYSVHTNSLGVIIESWNSTTGERTGSFAIDFKNIEGTFKD